MKDWRVQAPLCEHCCWCVARPRGRLIEELCDRLDTAVRLLRFIGIGIGGIVLSIAMFIEWLFPHVAENAREDKELERVLSHERVAQHYINETRGVYQWDSPHNHADDASMVSEYNALLQAVSSKQVDARAAEPQLARLSNELKEKRRIRSNLNTEIESLERSYADYMQVRHRLDKAIDDASGENDYRLVEMLLAERAWTNRQLDSLEKKARALQNHFWT